MYDFQTKVVEYSDSILRFSLPKKSKSKSNRSPVNRIEINPWQIISVAHGGNRKLAVYLNDDLVAVF